jgi:two-component system, sensor histidine kinase PdtaS
MDAPQRHLRLLTTTIEAVNSSLDLQEVLELVAHEVASALHTDACFVYLHDDPSGELVLRATHGVAIEDHTHLPRMRLGEGITGFAAGEREPVMIPSRAHLDPRFKRFPNLPEEDYESILAVPILAKDKLEGALNVRTREPRAFTTAEQELLVAIAAQVAQTIEHAKLYEAAQARVRELEALSSISEAVSESLYLEEAIEAIVRTTIASLDATGAAIVLEDGQTAWPAGRPGAHTVRMPLRWKGHQIGELVVDHDRPFTPEHQRLLEAIAHQAAVALEHGRMALRGVLAQEIHHRVKNNLQTVASLLRLQARAENVDPRKALTDSVNRILAIAAVHEVLTEHREDVVDLQELLDRLRAMLVQGLVAGKSVSAELEAVPVAGQLATSLALVFSELLGNALEHGGTEVHISLHRSGDDVVLEVSDNGAGKGSPTEGTGLSIVRALVRDELRGTLTLDDEPGLRASVRFPAGPGSAEIGPTRGAEGAATVAVAAHATEGEEAAP